MVKIKYRGRKMIIKEVKYINRYYCTRISGILILLVNVRMGRKEKSKIIHKILKTQN